MVSKTREKFIEVARQLFARKGVENTTMNDIANASDKGRSTIYTYFKSKRDIFNAVIERETDQVLGRLQEIVAKPVPASEKLLEYIECRFETMKEIVAQRISACRFLPGCPQGRQSAEVDGCKRGRSASCDSERRCRPGSVRYFRYPQIVSDHHTDNRRS